MVARFIAVDILPYQAGDVAGDILAFQMGIGKEQGIKPFKEEFLGAVEFQEAFIVLRSEPGILPGGAFALVRHFVGGMIRAERGPPTAVG